DAEQRVLLRAIRQVKKLKCAEPFATPFDWFGQKLMDYPKTISRPMDLSLIEGKLVGHKYSSAKDVRADMELIVKNCKQFFGDKHKYTSMVNKMATSF
ncbi:Bromodomain-containing protein, partial [Catenaria anguillulae PL171]